MRSALRRRAAGVASVACFAWLMSGAARAQGHEPAHGPGNPAAAQHAPQRPGAAPHDAADPHRAAEHGAAQHAEHAEHDESAPPPPINWWHGFLGEKANQEPNVLWRAPGEPPPFGASLLNFAGLLAIVVVLGKKQLSEALVKRKSHILHEIENAQRLREAAEKRLAEYESKLEKIHEELDRVRRDFLEQGERDKARIVNEAKERRERLKKDAEILLAQESKQLRQELVSEVVAQATKMATELLAKEMTLGDHDRFAESFLHDLRSGARKPGSGSVAPSAAAKGGAS